ncbi:MAG: hypothetical protein K6L81_16000 [Agarilytica sp.]
MLEKKTMKSQMKEAASSSLDTPIFHTLSIAVVVLFVLSLFVVTTRSGMLPFLWVVG